MFRLAHISDIHLGPLPPVTRRELASKRITGYLNWRRNRKDAMADGSLETLVSHMLANTPDHVAVTGDLINLALKEEIRLARAWLERVGEPRDVTVVPGNHDTYVRGAQADFTKAWWPYLVGDSDATSNPFPSLRRRGNVALIGVNSGRVSLPFYATGTFGRTNEAATSKLLQEAAADGAYRVVMIHHPPFPKATASHKRLIGATRFRDMIEREGADLVLHGHTHVVSHETIAGPGGVRVPVIGVPSASAAPRVGINANHESKRPAGRYNLFEIDHGNGRSTCRWAEYGYADGETEVSLIESRVL
ncbi:metallophosphoesterase [Rhizobiaceae bacterium]|nr:metallophosphoesterase [Rhizobiaceae bacterium]